MTPRGDVPPEIVRSEDLYVQLMEQARPGTEERTLPMPVWNLDGVWWTDAPPPPVWHAHWPQSVGLMSDGVEVRRCPCGATLMPASDSRWISERADRRRIAPGPLSRLLRRNSGTP